MLGWDGVGWGGSCRGRWGGGGVGHVGLGWSEVGWGVLCRGGVGWVM